MKMRNRILLLCACTAIISSCNTQGNKELTQITRWPDGKTGAVSLTYDDATANQFHKAVPIMNDLNLKATFFINTGAIKGSKYRGTFIGRPVQEIIKETATTPTDSSNFYERSSAAAYLGLKGTLQYHLNAGAAIDAGRPARAYRIIDELYRKVRHGDFPPLKGEKYEILDTVDASWDDLRKIAAQGHEFASHMVTHPRLGALDEPNIKYELEKSREELLDQLGERHTFSAEVPFGTENELAMDYALKVYPALRNRMPEPYLTELNRGSRKQPGTAETEYVQWQRGAVKRTPLPMMESWIDTTLVHNNIWLVLVFHGVDGIGWEALPSELLKEYFTYLKSKEDNLWIATFGDVTKYMRERMNSDIKTEKKSREITVDITNTLDTTMYNIPLTLKTYIPSRWKDVQVVQDNSEATVNQQQDSTGYYILYHAIPNIGKVTLSSR
jgi:peptidoglycan/xylan/chitin deacetylase (PgdA/CDA1 family)